MAVVNQPYIFVLTAWGGILPYTWEIVQGELPAGLSLDSASGLISGTPVQGGQKVVSIRVTDSAIARYTGEPQAFIEKYRLTVLSATGLKGSRAAPLGGVILGMPPRAVRCSNVTTGRAVRIGLNGTASWDCEPAGLIVNSGDWVALTIARAQVADSSTDISGSVTGMVPTEGSCRNVTTGHTVRLKPDGTTSWDCAAAGLMVNPGDHLTLTVSGIAE
jgi:Putative Ig domain